MLFLRAFQSTEMFPESASRLKVDALSKDSLRYVVKAVSLLCDASFPKWWFLNILTVSLTFSRRMWECVYLLLSTNGLWLLQSCEHVQK